MKNRRRYAAIALTILFGAFAIFTKPAGAETVYVSSEEGLRVRSKPGTSDDCKILQVLPFGTEVAIVDDDPDLGGWLRVEGDGYIDGQYAQDTDPKENWELLGEWRVTAYAETGYCCANGAYPTVGYTIACNSLPFGTQVYIDGVGFRTVEDTDGGAMGNEWLDLYLGDYTTCVQWGDQKRKVWRVSE